MEPTRRTPAHRRGAAVRDAVLQATTELLMDHGAIGTRIADIAAKAGVHETSIYRRWDSRASLIAEALSQLMNAELPLPDTGSAREDLTVFFTALGAFLATPTGRSVTKLGFDPPEDETPFNEVRGQFWTARLSRARVLVQRGIDRGELRPGTDPELLLEALAGPLHLRVLQRDQPVGGDYLSRLVDLVLSGTRA